MWLASAVFGTADFLFFQAHADVDDGGDGRLQLTTDISQGVFHRWWRRGHDASLYHAEFFQFLLFVVTGWSTPLGHSLKPWPRVRALCARVAERAAVQAAQAAEKAA